MPPDQAGETAAAGAPGGSQVPDLGVARRLCRGTQREHRRSHRRGRMRLHQWVFATDSWRKQHGLEAARPPLTRRSSTRSSEMSAPRHGPQDVRRRRRAVGRDLDGLWGEEPPFDAPVFVLTHHPREPLPMQGGTTFTFVTNGIESALEQARTAAGDKDVSIAGGASAVAAIPRRRRMLDECSSTSSRFVLGAGSDYRNVGDPTLDAVSVVPSRAVTHLKYSVVLPLGQGPRPSGTEWPCSSGFRPVAARLIANSPRACVPGLATPLAFLAISFFDTSEGLSSGRGQR